MSSPPSSGVLTDEFLKNLLNDAFINPTNLNSKKLNGIFDMFREHSEELLFMEFSKVSKAGMNIKGDIEWAFRSLKQILKKLMKGGISMSTAEWCGKKVVNVVQGLFSSIIWGMLIGPKKVCNSVSDYMALIGLGISCIGLLVYAIIVILGYMGSAINHTIRGVWQNGTQILSNITEDTLEKVASEYAKKLTEAAEKYCEDDNALCYLYNIKPVHGDILETKLLNALLTAKFTILEKETNNTLSQNDTHKPAAIGDGKYGQNDTVAISQINEVYNSTIGNGSSNSTDLTNRDAFNVCHESECENNKIQQFTDIQIIDWFLELLGHDKNKLIMNYPYEPSNVQLMESQKINMVYFMHDLLKNHTELLNEPTFKNVIEETKTLFGHWKEKGFRGIIARGSYDEFLTQSDVQTILFTQHALVTQTQTMFIDPALKPRAIGDKYLLKALNYLKSASEKTVLALRETEKYENNFCGPVGCVNENYFQTIQQFEGFTKALQEKYVCVTSNKAITDYDLMQMFVIFSVVNTGLATLPLSLPFAAVGSIGSILYGANKVLDPFGNDETLSKIGKQPQERLRGISNFLLSAFALGSNSNNTSNSSLPSSFMFQSGSEAEDPAVLDIPERNTIPTRTYVSAVHYGTKFASG